MEGANRSNHSYKFFLPVSEETKRALSRAPPFSPSPPTLVSSARGCLHKKKQAKRKKKDDTKYRCVRGAQRSGGKETIGRREGKKKRKKKKGRNNETCFQLANKFPLSSILPTLLSSRTRNYASEWNEAATFPKVNFFPSPPPPPPPPPPTVVYTRAEWPFTVVRNRNDSRDSWKPTLSFVVRIEKCDSSVCN